MKKKTRLGKRRSILFRVEISQNFLRGCFQFKLTLPQRWIPVRPRTAYFYCPLPYGKHTVWGNKSISPVPSLSIYRPISSRGVTLESRSFAQAFLPLLATAMLRSVSRILIHFSQLSNFDRTPAYQHTHIHTHTYIDTGTYLPSPSTGYDFFLLLPYFYYRLASSYTVCSRREEIESPVT